MRYKWLNRSNNDKLIIFYNGWGMDENIVKHLEPENYDIVMFYDYNNLETDFIIDKEYAETNIIAWSMGVMIAGLNKYPFDGKFIAINGTFSPINERYGIHPRIYDLTIKSFDEKCRDKFIENMFDKNWPDFECSRTLENQKTELIALKSYRTDNIFTPDKIIISDNDKIIPTKSQCNFWGIEPNFHGGHCPFFSFKKWSELL